MAAVGIRLVCIIVIHFHLSSLRNVLSAKVNDSMIIRGKGVSMSQQNGKML